MRLAPNLPVPISSYLDWTVLVDTGEDSRAVEHRLVVDGYLHDPDFDRWYSLSAVMSLLSTPPPGPLEQLATPTMFLVARRGPTPAYIADLYRQLPAIGKQMVDIDGGVYWMLSHPQTAAKIVCGWFDGSLTPPESPSPA